MKVYVNFVLMMLIGSMMVGCGGVSPVVTDDLYDPAPWNELAALNAPSPESLPVQSLTGGVAAIGFGATVRNLAKVASGAPGTFIWASQDMKTIMFCWQEGTKNYGFFAIGNKSGLTSPVRSVQAMMNGNRTGTLTMSAFLNDLKAQGWRVISPSQLPAPILIALQGAGSWLSGLASINPVLPIFIIPSLLPLAPSPPL